MPAGAGSVAVLNRNFRSLKFRIIHRVVPSSLKPLLRPRGPPGVPPEGQGSQPCSPAWQPSRDARRWDPHWVCVGLTRAQNLPPHLSRCVFGTAPWFQLPGSLKGTCHLQESPSLLQSPRGKVQAEQRPETGKGGLWTARNRTFQAE